MTNPPLEAVQPGIELGAECMDPSLSATGLLPSGGNIIETDKYWNKHLLKIIAVLPGLGVPETSYSSSDDEDFFDANDYSHSASLPVSPMGIPPR